jgi:hypothetical protein
VTAVTGQFQSIAGISTVLTAILVVISGHAIARWMWTLLVFGHLIRPSS